MLRFTSFILASSFGLAAAAPQYYTFTGKVTMVPSDQGGYAAAHNIKAGLDVAFIFMVDTARIGYTLFDGSRLEKQDISNPGYKANNFFDTLITASLFQGAVPASPAGSFFGYHTVTTLGSTVRASAALQTQIGEPDKETQLILYLTAATETAFLPVVGDKVTASESYVDGATANSSASMSLTLVGVSDTKPFTAVGPARFEQARISARRLGSGWEIGNRSGAPLALRVQDLGGRSILEETVGGNLVIPAERLPQGLVILSVTDRAGFRQVLPLR